MSIKTAKGTWKVIGINLISSDSIYQKIKSAIESGNATQKNLQTLIGHNSPIVVNQQERSIILCNF